MTDKPKIYITDEHNLVKPGIALGDEFVGLPRNANNVTIRISGLRQTGKTYLATIVADALREALGDNLTLDVNLTDIGRIGDEPETPYLFNVKIIEDLPR